MTGVVCVSALLPVLVQPSIAPTYTSKVMAIAADVVESLEVLPLFANGEFSAVGAIPSPSSSDVAFDVTFDISPVDGIGLTAQMVSAEADGLWQLMKYPPNVVNAPPAFDYFQPYMPWDRVVGGVMGQTEDTIGQFWRRIPSLVNAAVAPALNPRCFADFFLF